MNAVLPDIDLDKFTVEQRLQLIDKIWESIPEGEYPVPESHLQLIRQRIAEHEANPHATTSWDEFKRELLDEQT